jgi:hypothetical protein
LEALEKALRKGVEASIHHAPRTAEATLEVAKNSICTIAAKEKWISGLEEGLLSSGFIQYTGNSI